MKLFYVAILCAYAALASLSLALSYYSVTGQLWASAILNALVAVYAGSQMFGIVRRLCSG